MILIFLSPFNSISFLLVVFWGFLILPMFPIPLRLGFLPNRYANKGQLFVSQCLTCFWLPAHWMQNLWIALQGVKYVSFFISNLPWGNPKAPSICLCAFTVPLRWLFFLPSYIPWNDKILSASLPQILCFLRTSL